MARRRKNYVEFIYCECGCRFTRPKYDVNNIECRFIKGHNTRNRKALEETKIKMRKAHIGKHCGSMNPMFGKNNETNPNWRGDNVGNMGLHKWIRKYLPRPKDGLCMLCHNNPIKQVACITNIYDRDFKNWAWFCFKCHHGWDNIYERTLRHRWDRNKKRL